MMQRDTRKNPLARGLRVAHDAANPMAATPREEISDARAAANVAEWRKFLPEDCIQTMIKAGWHRTV